MMPLSFSKKTLAFLRALKRNNDRAWFHAHRDEYEAHVYDRRCDAKACRELLVYEIDATLCKGCGICIKQCPSDAIVGAPKSAHHIIPERCVACGSCVDACNLDAVLVH